MPGVPGRHDTVEKVDSPGDSLNDVAGGSDAHKIPGFLLRHMGLYRLYDFIHHLGALPYGQATNGVAGQVQLRNPLHMCHANVPIGSTLVDAPKHLLGVHRIRKSVQSGIFCLTPLQPPIGPVHALLHIVPWRRIFNAFEMCIRDRYGKKPR